VNVEILPVLTSSIIDLNRVNVKIVFSLNTLYKVDVISYFQYEADVKIRVSYFVQMKSIGCYETTY